MSDLEQLMASEQEMLLVYQQGSILKEINLLIEEFDKGVLHLRHERSQEEIKIKSAEMKLVQVTCILYTHTYNIYYNVALENLRTMSTVNFFLQ